MLLHTVKGPTSFEDLRTVNGELCQTNREACLKLGLLENDDHWDKALEEATLTSHPRQIRNLFAIIITTCAPSDPKGLWDKHKESLSEDILRKTRILHPNIDVQFSDEIFNEALILLEEKCISINNKTLFQLGLPAPMCNRSNLTNRDLMREKQYNVYEQREYVENHEKLLNEDQRRAYEMVMQKIAKDNGGIIFLDAPGGTGKTFLLNLILAKVRSEEDIAVAVASSGIASTLLNGGRTAHSTFKLPLNYNQNETPTCNIGKNSAMAKVLQMCKIIVWDECSMAHKRSFEALDRTLRDLKGNDHPMGKIIVLLAGDFRQILPVIPRSTPADEINACLKSSYLWQHVEKMQLETNMRIHLNNDSSAKSSLQEMINSVYPNISNNYKNHDWLYERAILAPKNDDVNQINHQILQRIPDSTAKFKSIDTVTNECESVNYPIEFLNSLEPIGMPPHVLSLKTGATLMIIRNLDPPKLCNGTRVAIKSLTQNLIVATIMNGKHKGEDVLIPRIPIISTESPIEFKRLQFPVRLAFAMTINKAQGQTLKIAGLNLRNPCFAHGQLYVGCAR
ncbi:uncharacterized protein LOC116346472, partial [Contarinia nasturtii]|uniref:uncharacterized protein LOC116346472 n=1 Tax=Contarinia nasturtii TaxID=265458 RepID=UPI0012D47F53